jgi:hypothetical protein
MQIQAVGCSGDRLDDPNSVGLGFMGLDSAGHSTCHVAEFRPQSGSARADSVPQFAVGRDEKHVEIVL